MNDRKKRLLRFAAQVCCAALLVGLDLFLKKIAAERLKGKPTYVWIPRFLGFTYAENTGAAFSMFSASTAALTVVTAVVIVGAFAALYLIKNKPLIYDIVVPLIIAGGTGNLIDRVRHGYVVDYIATLFMDFPIFNFADCLITCGCFVLIGYLLIDLFRADRKPEPDASGAQNAGEEA